MPDPEGMPKPAPGENSGIIEFKVGRGRLTELTADASAGR